MHAVGHARCIGVPGHKVHVDHERGLCQEIMSAASRFQSARPLDRREPAALVAAARPDGNDPALLWFLLRGVGNDDATSGLRLGIDTLNDNAVVKRAKFHGFLVKVTDMVQLSDAGSLPGTLG
jgi:hypothetical protein